MTMAQDADSTRLQVEMREAIDALPNEKERELCREIVWGGSGFREASEKYGVPEWKVLRVLRRALAGVAAAAGIRRRSRKVARRS